MAKTKTLEKKQGLWLTYKADVEVGDCSVKFIKGYVEGFEGINLSKFGLNIGIGVGEIKFWSNADDEDCTIECPKGASPLKKCLKIKVSYKVIYLLLFPITKTREIGRICANKCCCYDKAGKVVAPLINEE